jgi:hypothetical protein
VNRNVKILVYFFPTIILGGLLIYLLYWRLQVGLTRFFDVDEFSYLHWASNVARGSMPYKDFFFYGTPGFLWFLAPLMKTFGNSIEVFIVARVTSFGIFLGMLALLGTLFAKTRSIRYVLVPVVILAFLPMPYDKLLEARPDNLMTFCALAGLVLEVFAIEGSGNRRRYWFFSGFFYMASLVVLVKTIPFAVVGTLIAIAATWSGKELRKQIPQELLIFIAGMAVPLVIFIAWIVLLGILPMAWYSLTKLPFEVNKISNFGPMEPDLFFFPNGSFYGGTKLITLSLIMNHGIWVIAGIMGAFRCLTPFITGKGNKRNALIEILVAGVFVSSIYGYITYWPLKHSQYLIPIAIFVAYYFADGVVWLLELADRKIPLYGMVCILLVGAYYFIQANYEVNYVKIGWSNDVQMYQAKVLIDTVKPTEEVLDLDGRMLFWKDAYYICCVPFGSFTGFMSRPPPPLRDVLEEKKTPYIYQGDSNRLSVLSWQDINYIKTMYAPVTGWGETFWKRK